MWHSQVRENECLYLKNKYQNNRNKIYRQFACKVPPFLNVFYQGILCVNISHCLNLLRSSKRRIYLLWLLSDTNTFLCPPINTNFFNFLKANKGSPHLCKSKQFLCCRTLKNITKKKVKNEVNFEFHIFAELSLKVYFQQRIS